MVIKEKLDWLLPKFCRIPLIFTVILNFSVYWGSRAIAGNWYHHNIETPVDAMIPTVYWTVLIYFGCYIFWIINYIYNARMSKEHCYIFLGTDWIGKVICFILYVAYPTTNTRPQIVGDGIWAELMRLLYRIDEADNLFPSIHCLVSWICYIGIRGNKKVPLAFRVFSCIMALAVCISTLTTKQHVIYDVVAGIALAEAGYFILGRIGRQKTGGGCAAVNYNRKGKGDKMNRQQDVTITVDEEEEFELLPAMGEFSSIASQYEHIMFFYESGIQQIVAKLQILNNEFKNNNERNPIENIKSRVKSMESIIDKMQRKGIPLTMNSMAKEIKDIAGVRVICPFISDVYQVANMLVNQQDVDLVTVKDYIKKPKENGYRSLHMIVMVDVYFSDHKDRVPIEIQFRTIAMNFWASTEHQLRYKKDRVFTEEMQQELKKCADIMAEADDKMQNLAIVSGITQPIN